MNKRNWWLACIAGVSLTVAPTTFSQENATNAGETAAQEQTPSRALEILHAADQATKELTAIRYRAEACATGALAGRAPVVHATVLKSMREDAPPLIVGEGWYYQPDRRNSEPTRFSASFDGNIIRRLLPERTLYVQGMNPEQVLGPVLRADMFEFGHPTPFQDEIDANIQELEGTTMVGDTLCNVVYVEYGAAGEGQKSRWYFGVEDSLPRRVERLDDVDGRPGAYVLTVTELDTSPEFSESDFTLEIPEDYREARTGGPRLEAGGLPVR